MARASARLSAPFFEDVPELARLRLSSIDSIEVDADLMTAIAEEPRLMPHFHLSLQHGDDMILKRMKRRHSRADAIRFTEAVRRLRPDVVFSADLIAGFPTETRRWRRIRFRSSTTAASAHFTSSRTRRVPARRRRACRVVDGAVIKRARRASARQKAAAAFAAHLASEQGTTRRLLVENGGVGRTEQFTLAEIDATPGISH